MSRAYQMAVRVNGVKKENMIKLLKVLSNEFWVNKAKDKLEEWNEGDRWFQKNKDGTYWFWLTEENTLNGGECEHEFALRVHKKIWEICPGVEVVVRATYLEDLPYEEYSFDYDDHKE